MRKEDVYSYSINQAKSMNVCSYCVNTFVRSLFILLLLTKPFLTKTLGDAALIEVFEIIWDESIVGLLCVHWRCHDGLFSIRCEPRWLRWCVLLLLFATVFFHIFPEAFFGCLGFCDRPEFRFILVIDFFENRWSEAAFVFLGLGQEFFFGFTQEVV